MIRSYKNKGLAEFARTGSTRRLSVQNAARINRLLVVLDTATAPEDMNIPGNHFHQLKGDREGTYSVRVTGNWRMTFGWEDGDATNIDLEDYHR